MLSLCKLKEDAKSAVFYSFWLWDRLKSIFHVGTALAKWILLKPGSLEHCIHGSDVYYKSVDGFGHSNFGKGNISMCNLRCAKILGDPKNLI